MRSAGQRKTPPPSPPQKRRGCGAGGVGASPRPQMQRAGRDEARAAEESPAGRELLLQCRKTSARLRKSVLLRTTASRNGALDECAAARSALPTADTSMRCTDGVDVSALCVRRAPRVAVLVVALARPALLSRSRRRVPLVAGKHTNPPVSKHPSTQPYTHMHTHMIACADMIPFPFALAARAWRRDCPESHGSPCSARNLVSFSESFHSLALSAATSRAIHGTLAAWTARLCGSRHLLVNIDG